jgi:hypothetical protein
MMGSNSISQHAKNNLIIYLYHLKNSENLNLIKTKQIMCNLIGCNTDIQGFPSVNCRKEQRITSFPLSIVTL